MIPTLWHLLIRMFFFSLYGRPSFLVYGFIRHFLGIVAGEKECGVLCCSFLLLLLVFLSLSSFSSLSYSTFCSFAIPLLFFFPRFGLVVCSLIGFGEQNAHETLFFPPLLYNILLSISYVLSSQVKR